MNLPAGRAFSTVRDLLRHETAGGLLLIAAAAAGLIFANSALSPDYFALLEHHVGPLSVLHWINDGLMAVFFLLVGLEIKRELLDGQLASWRRRILPGICAAGGMIAPSLLFIAFNIGEPRHLVGWAIPAATDIAFALAIVALLGSRVPASLKIFLTALAILDDLGAIVLIGLFYGGGIDLGFLALAALVVAGLIGMNRAGVGRLWPYLLLGALLWVLVLKSGLHATIAGVTLALCVPLKISSGTPDDVIGSPLHKLEHGIQAFVGLVVLPVFGLANAGVSLAGLGIGDVWNPLTLGVLVGLFIGKLVGVFGTAAVAIAAGVAERPSGSTWLQLFGVAMLCGIGFTMSLFIGSLAFATGSVELTDAKLGIVGGSILAAFAGWAILRVAPRSRHAG